MNYYYPKKATSLSWCFDISKKIFRRCDHGNELSETFYKTFAISYDAIYIKITYFHQIKKDNSYIVLKQKYLYKTSDDDDDDDDFVWISPNVFFVYLCYMPAQNLLKRRAECIEINPKRPCAYL